MTPGHGGSNSAARRASSSHSFITFFKSLFGAGLLALPNVLGRVGLLLGTALYLLVGIGCALTCYVLLKAREIA
eukprot:CAMPEP_0183310080 /NCGR_PEP_ID=MMETSP0160_2-20130417/28856_1 /TAXON_ID=2839 ORGANISM="Odontella Sinensis, Strain Grunow 1884" /NCGR_SAMPLE_ID=MMETSP0160_2 /ASSEMBLY_ACC=CAM_ASM_000250 /LENGTH=73 /DNA_ID=CAMNT_0025474233 /DNA_START=97 /DNA_END=314 /DNA_ORIENTATION=+